MEVVHDLSDYVEAGETGTGNRTANSLRQRKERARKGDIHLFSLKR